MLVSISEAEKSYWFGEVRLVSKIYRLFQILWSESKFLQCSDKYMFREKSKDLFLSSLSFMEILGCDRSNVCLKIFKTFFYFHNGLIWRVYRAVYQSSFGNIVDFWWTHCSQFCSVRKSFTIIACQDHLQLH